MAVYLSVLKPGDTVLGMSLSSGGHLTHGHSVNFSGKLFNFIPYGVSPEDDLLDYDEIEILANQHKPRMIVAGASAYSRIIDFARISAIAHNNKALFFADMAHIAGLVATSLHPSPIPVADFVSSTTHKTLRGPRGGFVISKLDYATRLDRTVMPGMQGGPLMNTIAAKAIAFEEASTPEFRMYQEQVIKNARLMAQTFKELGYYIITGGTDNHLFLINLKKSQPKNLASSDWLNGLVVEQLLERCNITLNRNAVPFDTESPLVTSGIRIGTAAITTRGLKESYCVEIANLIHEAICSKNDEQKLHMIAQKIEAIAIAHPLNM
jgi:glycine hydroxymethyltransferase